MAKRKTKKAPVRRKTALAPGRAKLDRVFACPYCNHERSVECRLDRTADTAALKCRVCQASYRSASRTSGLTEPVDVYYEWIDRIHAADASRAAAAADIQ